MNRMRWMVALLVVCMGPQESWSAYTTKPANRMVSFSTLDLCATSLGAIDQVGSSAVTVVTYSASMTLDMLTGSIFSITATNGTAFTINAPTNPTTGQQLTVTIRNTSGGAAGVATWNAAFKMTTWTQPATGFSRSIDFYYDGTNWVETNRSAADVSN